MDSLQVTDIRNSRSRSRTPFLRSSCDQQSCTTGNHEHSEQIFNVSTGSDEVFDTKTTTKITRKSQRKNVFTHNKILDYSSEDGQISSDGGENEQVDMSIYNNKINSSIESKIASQHSQNSVNGTKSESKHLAHKLYKEAGDYWNKYPKTDYTYSPLSQDRHEIAPGVIAMPNMSRRSLHAFDENSFTYNDTRNTIKSRKNFQFEEHLPARRLEHLINSKQHNISYLSQSETVWQKILRITRISLLYTTILYYCSSAWNAVFRNKIENVSMNKEIHRNHSETKRWYSYIWESITSVVSWIILIYYGIQYQVMHLDTWFINAFPLHARQKTIYLILGFLLLPLLLLSVWLAAMQILDTGSTVVTYVTFALQNTLSNINKLPYVFSLIPFSLFANNTKSDIETQEQLHSIYVDDVYPNDAIYSDKEMSNSHSYNENKINFVLTPEVIYQIQQIVQKTIDERHQNNVVNTIPQEKINEIVYLTRDQLIQDNQLRDLIFTEDMILTIVKEVNKNIERDIKLTPSLITQIVEKIHSDNKIINSDLLIDKFLTSTQFSNLMLSHTDNIKNDIKDNIRNLINEQNLAIASLKNKMNEIKMEIVNNDLVKNDQKSIKLKLAHLQYLMQEQNRLNTIFNAKLQLYYNRSFNVIESHLHKLLNDILTSTNSKLKEEMFTWAQNVFVTKDDLEEKFTQVNMKPEDYKQFISLSSATIHGQISKNIDEKLSEYGGQIENFKLEHDLLKSQITELSTKFTFFINEQKQALELFIRQQQEEKILLTNKHKELILTQATLDEKFKEMGIKLNQFIEIQNNERAKFLEMQSKSIPDLTVNTISQNKLDVEKIVKNLLAIYDADKTGQVDYALESAGGQILSIRCTEHYQSRSAEISLFGIPIWYPSNSPRMVINTGIVPGSCWSFQNFPGFLVIGLSARIQVTAFSLEHISKLLVPSGKIDSAPQKFSVWGLEKEMDPLPFKFGEYIYNADGPPLQYFAVENVDAPPFKIVELRIDSNHGHDNYTCLYRFRVHGKLAETESDNSTPP